MFAKIPKCAHCLSTRTGRGRETRKQTARLRIAYLHARSTQSDRCHVIFSLSLLATTLLLRIRTHTRFYTRNNERDCVRERRTPFRLANVNYSREMPRSAGKTINAHFFLFLAVKRCVKGRNKFFFPPVFLQDFCQKKAYSFCFLSSIIITG